MAKKAAATVLVKLLSSAGTGYFYVAKKNPRKLPQKLEFMKYDPRVRRHVLFSEVKLRDTWGVNLFWGKEIITHTDTMWEVKLMAMTTSLALGMFVLHAIQLILENWQST